MYLGGTIYDSIWTVHPFLGIASCLSVVCVQDFDRFHESSASVKVKIQHELPVRSMSLVAKGDLLCATGIPLSLASNM